MVYFYLYLGKWSNLTNIFQVRWNHQPETHTFSFWLIQIKSSKPLVFTTHNKALWNFSAKFESPFFIRKHKNKLIRPWKIWMMGRPVLSFSWIFATFWGICFLYFLLLDFCHPLVHTFAFCKTYIPICQLKQNSRAKYPCKFCLHGPETKNKWFVLSSNFLHRGRCRVC